MEVINMGIFILFVLSLIIFVLFNRKDYYKWIIIGIVILLLIIIFNSNNTINICKILPYFQYKDIFKIYSCPKLLDICCFKISDVFTIKYIESNYLFLPFIITFIIITILYNLKITWKYIILILILILVILVILPILETYIESIRICMDILLSLLASEIIILFDMYMIEQIIYLDYPQNKSTKNSKLSFVVKFLSSDNFMAGEIKKGFNEIIESNNYKLCYIKEKYDFLKNAGLLNLTYAFILILVFLLLNFFQTESNSLNNYFLNVFKIIILYKTISRTIMTILLFSEDIIGKDKAEIKKRVMERIDEENSDYLDENNNLSVISEILKEKDNFTEEEKLLYILEDNKTIFTEEKFAKNIEDILKDTQKDTQKKQKKNIIQRLMKELNISDIDENYKIEKTYINNQSNETCKDKCNYDFNLKSVNNEKNNNKTIYKHLIKSFIKEHIFMSKSDKIKQAIFMYFEVILLNSLCHFSWQTLTKEVKGETIVNSNYFDYLIYSFGTNTFTSVPFDKIADGVNPLFKLLLYMQVYASITLVILAITSYLGKEE